MNLLDCKELLLELCEGVLSVTLNRPHKRNAMNDAMVSELMAVFAAIADDRSVRAVVLRGAEGHFCAGGDIGGMSDSTRDAQGNALPAEQATWNFNRRFGELISQINHAPQVVIAVLEGAVLGGGFGLCCVSDVAIADSQATFAMPETGLGIIPAQIAPFVVLRAGLTQARRLALTGERIKGEEAARLGLVHFVTQGAEALQLQLEQTLNRVRHCAPQANAVSKALMLDVGQYALSTLLDRAADDFTAAMNGVEGQEGTLAFLEKRKPVWADPATKA